MDASVADANVTADAGRDPDTGPPMCGEIGDACSIRSDCCFGLVCATGQCLCFRAGDTAPCGTTLPDGTFVHAYCCSRHATPVPGNESNCACALSQLGDRCMSDADCEVGTCADNVGTDGGSGP